MTRTVTDRHGTVSVVCPCGWNRIVLDWESVEQARAEHEASDVHQYATRYRDAYNRGWRYSATASASLDTADRRGWSASEAWMDGYLDRAAGRAKWHLRDCLDHSLTGCGEA